MTALADAPYIPAGGLAGKLRRLAARTLAVTPLNVRLTSPLISFSFDDAPLSSLTNGATILQGFGWRATYYIAGGFDGRTTHLGPMHDGPALKDIAARGHEIACHTYAHDDLSRVSAQQALSGCGKNRDYLSSQGLGSHPETFAFPYGEASPGAKRALLGPYRALRGVRPGINRGRTDRGLLKAVPLDGGEAGLGQALQAVADVKAEPGWLIFYGHDVRTGPSQWGCSPNFLETVCRACEGLDVRPVARALDLVEGLSG
ncbi:polysaccharide deacetylase family protein [Alkalicaulis satelles]|uniref:Chitooligosaccharide deacetylase n=1 Tax=Alkalicaulis satelles TaxID=2609175 RepID=A0A5M6ZIP8_9PROT|nr:polysaccharide deacetylase family protein [Alkalicaulis satelles]KAA5804703.1 polysaccharide deacetylase family protein [Alkalicaulis satelles]